MGTDRYRDFDAFFAEMQREPVKLKLFGEEHELPPSLPAVVILRAMRIEGQEVVPESEVFRMAEDIFGEERLEDWCEKGLDVDQLTELIRWATSIYRGGRSEESAGNAKAPKKGARTSSKTGR